MPTEIKIGLKVKGMKEKVIVKELCDECGRELPPARLEARSYGHSEFITYCPCGATYKS